MARGRGGELTCCGVSDGLAGEGEQYPLNCVTIACPVRLFPMVPLVGQSPMALQACPRSQTNFAFFNIAWSSFRGCVVGVQCTHTDTYTSMQTHFVRCNFPSHHALWGLFT